MSTETTDQKVKEKPKQQRTRSPGYPTTHLEEAIQKAKVVWEKDGKHQIPIESLATHWGFSEKSSSAQQFSAALKKFGLLDDVPDRPGTVKLSDMAVRIICDDPTSAARVELIKKAALSPGIYAKLWQKYEGNPPSDTTIKQYLLVDLSFNKDAVDKAIQDFRSTITFAKLTPDDKVSGIDNDDQPEEHGLNHPAYGEGLGKIAASMTASAAGTSMVTGRISALREFVFPLSNGMAALKVPFPMGEDDFDFFMETLKLWKKKLVSKPLPPIPANAMYRAVDGSSKPVKIMEFSGEVNGVRWFLAEDGIRYSEDALVF